MEQKPTQDFSESQPTPKSAKKDVFPAWTYRALAPALLLFLASCAQQNEAYAPSITPIGEGDGGGKSTEVAPLDLGQSEIEPIVDSSELERLMKKEIGTSSLSQYESDIMENIIPFRVRFSSTFQGMEMVAVPSLLIPEGADETIIEPQLFVKKGEGDTAEMVSLTPVADVDSNYVLWVEPVEGANGKPLSPAEAAVQGYVVALADPNGNLAFRPASWMRTDSQSNLPVGEYAYAATPMAMSLTAEPTMSPSDPAYELTTVGSVYEVVFKSAKPIRTQDDISSNMSEESAAGSVVTVASDGTVTVDGKPQQTSKNEGGQEQREYKGLLLYTPEEAQVLIASTGSMKPEDRPETLAHIQELTKHFTYFRPGSVAAIRVGQLDEAVTSDITNTLGWGSNTIPVYNAETDTWSRKDTTFYTVFGLESGYGLIFFRNTDGELVTVVVDQPVGDPRAWSPFYSLPENQWWVK